MKFAMAWNRSRADQWIYMTLAVLFVAAAFIRTVLDGEAGVIAVRVAGVALLLVFPWLGLRSMIPKLIRQSTEDKIVRDFRSYLSNPLPEIPPPVIPPADFKSARVVPRLPNPTLVVHDALPPRSRSQHSTVSFNWPHAA